jgi:hypothetical protein
MKNNLPWLLAAAFGVVLTGQAAFHRFVEIPVVTSEASWAFRPASVADATDKATAVVEGEVVSVTRGEDIVSSVAGEPNNETRIPTQRIRLRVDSVLKGTARVGDVLDVFQTGGLAAPTGSPNGKQGMRADTHLVVTLDDPLYQPGEQYLLMLEDGPRGMLRSVAPEGRYRIEANRTLTPMIDNSVTRGIKGKSVIDMERTVRNSGMSPQAGL